MESKRYQKTFFTRTPVPPFRRRLLHGRTANFNSAEKRVLVQLVEPYKDVVDSKKNDVTTVKEKENIWNHLIRVFNSRFRGQKPREPRNLQRLWKNIKSKAKAQNTEIDAMLDSESPRTLLQPIKTENQSECLENGFHETVGHSSESELSPAHSFSTEPTLEGSEDFSSFKYIAPKPCLELPTLVQMGKGKNEGDLKSPCVENSKPSPTENTTVSENSVPSFSATNGGSSNDPNASASFTEIEYKGTGLDATIHNFGARSEYDDNVLLMKQLEHEQRLKNLRYEHEMKREEHTLRMDLLKEEMEFVRLRKELLKRQLDTYISVLNV